MEGWLYEFSVRASGKEMTIFANDDRIRPHRMMLRHLVLSVLCVTDQVSWLRLEPESRYDLPPDNKLQAAVPHFAVRDINISFPRAKVYSERRQCDKSQSFLQRVSNYVPDHLFYGCSTDVSGTLRFNRLHYTIKTLFLII